MGTVASPHPAHTTSTAALLEGRPMINTMTTERDLEGSPKVMAYVPQSVRSREYGIA